MSYFDEKIIEDVYALLAMERRLLAVGATLEAIKYINEAKRVLENDYKKKRGEY